MVELTTVAIGVLLSIELGYFVKAAIYGFGSRFLLPKVHPLAMTKSYGICTTRDVDFLLNHINNARYLRAMDFGRVDHFARSRMYTAAAAAKAQVLVASSTIRYRKSIYLFMPYRLETQIIFWDERNIYYRQNFSTLHDNFLRATAYVKIAVVGLRARDLITSIAKDVPESMDAPEDLLMWIQYNKLNSDSLKKIK